MTKRKSFTAEFKREAVRLLESSKKRPSDLARELVAHRGCCRSFYETPLDKIH